jgi:DNA-binding NarL/FixJ family response regulator
MDHNAGGAAMNRIRVLVAEDHETVRQGLRLLLESQGDIDVVAEAPDGQVAVSHCQAFRPHVAILDISMPEMNGLAAAVAIKASVPEVAIVAWSRHDDQAFVHELTAAGVSGYVLKQSRSSELLTAIRTVARGERYLDATLTARLRQAEEGLARTTGAQPSVSDRERDVLRMMAIGHSNKEIAGELGISVKTVEVHKANGMRKLGLRGRIDVVRFAILHGWLQDR